MDKKKVLLAAMAAVLLVLTLLNVRLLLSGRVAREVHTSDVVYDTTVRVDTVRVVEPVAKDSVVTRYVVARLALADSAISCRDTSYSCHDTAIVCQELSRHGVAKTVARDSVAVVVPITQKEYADSTYRAWVSGYMARLDSIEVYSRRETVRRTARRWGVGLTAGYGFGKDGLTPWVGLGLMWRVF